MGRTDRKQPNIGRTLCELLPVGGAPKTLRELKKQVRLLNDIRHPDDAGFGRVILGYLQEPQHTEGARFHPVDMSLHPEDPDGRWTRVRIGPSVLSAVPGGLGPEPSRRVIEASLSEIWKAQKQSDDSSFHLWDLLKSHFDVTKDNNSHYRSWLKMLAEALVDDERFVMIAIDEKTKIPVEWMLTEDRQEEIAASVRGQIPEIVSFMRDDPRLVFMTRELVRRFFGQGEQGEVYDIHAYFQEVSAALAEHPACIEQSVTTASGPAEAWCVKSRVCDRLRDCLDDLHEWAQSAATIPSAEVIVRRCFPSGRQLQPRDLPDDLVAEVLSEDPRFLPLSGDRAGFWDTIPGGARENASAYRILFDRRRPYSESALAAQARERFPAYVCDFSLNWDRRFKRWSRDLWGLSEWVGINDQAYEMLQNSETPLESEAITDAVCCEYDIAPHVAIFDPHHDSRFVQLPDGRWRLAYRLQEADLQKMLEFLLNSGTGQTLEDLVFWTIGLQAGGTDAEERLSEDDRFILREGLWYGREEVYALSDDDLDALFAELQRVGTGLRLSTLLLRVLDRDVGETDAAERLEEDGRFCELLPDVWAVADIKAQYGERQRMVNLAFRSERLVSISEAEFLESTEKLTYRKPVEGQTGWSGTEISRTLSLGDVDHGSLRMTGNLETLLGSEKEAFQIIDDKGNEFTCWVDTEAALLCGFATWFEMRELTYGDRIVFRSGGEEEMLQIEATGRRDEEVYKEALQHKDLDRVLESARKSGKSYHDLIIEVLQHFNRQAGRPMPVHRETIYELVNKMRIANRNTIFSLLSLPQCSYEELRYFIKHGGGYWSYDPDLHRSFELMKLKSAEGQQDTEVDDSQLEQNMIGNGAAVAKDVADRNGTLQQALTEHQQQVAELKSRNRELETARSALKEDIARLNVEIADGSKENQALRETIAETQDALRAAEDRAMMLKQEHEQVVEGLEDEIMRQSEDLATLQRDLQKTEQQCHEAVRGLELSRDRNTELREENTALCEAKRGLEELNERYRQTFTGLVSKSLALRQQVASLQASLAKQERALKMQMSEMKRLKNERDALQATDAKLRSQLETSSELHNDLEQKIKGLQSDVRRLENNADVMRERLERASCALGQRLTELDEERGKSAALEIEIDRLTDELTRRTAAAKELEARLDALNEGLQTGRGRILRVLSRLLGGPDLV